MAVLVSTQLAKPQMMSSASFHRKATMSPSKPVQKEEPLALALTVTQRNGFQPIGTVQIRTLAEQREINAKIEAKSEIESRMRALDEDEWEDLTDDLRDIGIVETRKVKKFSDWVAARQNLPEAKLWRHFQTTVKVKTNKPILKELASIWLLDEIKSAQSKGNKTIANMIYTIQHAFRRWGISFDEATTVYANNLKKKENKATAIRKMDNLEKKAQQYHSLKKIVPQMIQWLGSATDGEFDSIVTEISDTGPEFLTKTGVDQIKPLLNMHPAKRNILRLKLRAMISLGVVTGLRGIGFWRLAKTDVRRIEINHEGEEGLFIYYGTRKNGPGKSDLMTKVTRVVHNIDPDVDCIAAYFEYLSVLPADTKYPFQFGKASRGTGKVAEMAHFRALRSQAVAFVEVAAVACGVEGMGMKKIHALRAFCTNALAEKGSSKDERMEHLGWAKTDVEGAHYMDKAYPVLNNNAPFIVAGREKKKNGLPRPAMWNFIDSLTERRVPGADSMSYGDKVCFLAAAAGKSPKIAPVIKVPEDFAHTVRNAKNEEVPLEGAALEVEKKYAKRVRDLELEVTALRAKVARLEGDPDIRHETAVDAVKRTEEALAVLSVDPENLDFPERCKKVVVEKLAHILDRYPAMGFLDADKALKKKVHATLRLAAFAKELVENPPPSRGRKYWFTWCFNSSAEFKKVHNGVKPQWTVLRKMIMPDN